MTDKTIELTSQHKREIIQSHILTWRKAQYDWTIAYQTKKIIKGSPEELKLIEEKIAESVLAIDALETLIKELGE